MLKLLFQNVDKKAYIFIILLTLFFMLIYFYVYKSTQDQISTLTQINLTTIINEVKTKSSNKLQETKSILENSAYYIANSEILNNDNDLIRFLSAIENMDDAVDTIQFMSEKNNLYLKGVIYRGQEAIDIEKKLHNLQNRPLPLEKPWYVKTKQENQTTTNIMEIHGLYGEETINICSPVANESEFFGVLCAIIRSNKIIDRIQQLSLPENTHIFILLQNKKILSKNEDLEIAKKIEDKIEDIGLECITCTSTQTFNIDTLLFSVSKLEKLSWKIIVGANTSAYQANMQTLFNNTILMLIAFVILILFANITHESIRLKLNKKFDRVKRLTTLWLKDSSRGLILYDYQKNISFANIKARRVLKLFSKKFGNLHVVNLLGKERDKSVVKIEKFGKEIFYEINVSPLYDGSLFEGWVVAIVDITKERVLAKQKDEYEQIVAHQGKMIEMGELIGGINHQLKQPLTSLSMFISNLQQQQKHGLLSSERLDENLSLCQKSLANLNETIDLYKNYYKIEQNYKIFSLKNSLENTLKIANEKIRRNNIKVQLIGEDFTINSMQNIIQQIFVVLLNNALDEAKESSKKEVVVAITCIDNEIKIAISDFGRGIDESIAKSLFSEIVTTCKEKGTGLGLYFANKLAQNVLQGKIKVANMCNPTTFELTFKQRI